MNTAPLELSLHVNPQFRFDAIDVARSIAEHFGDVLDQYKNVLYCSHHTTAGFLEQRLALQLEDRRDKFDPYIRTFQGFFPEDAGYTHDKMHLRNELTADQKDIEPPNGDAHLTFIGAGMKSCVTYRHRPNTPVFLMDLDGVYKGNTRTRKTSLIAYNEEQAVDQWNFDIPVSSHSIDSINLTDSRIGLMQSISEMLAKKGVESGRVDIHLEPEENASALTVNEFETLLMRHDLAEVLRNPMKFMASQGRRMLSDPRAVPAKTIGYARYDVVRLLNTIIDSCGLKDSMIDTIVSRLMAYPARRMLHWKRSISIPVSSSNGNGPQLIKGQYQAPILIQWKASPRQTRRLKVQLTRFS